MAVAIDSFSALVERYAPTVSDFFFIQVGANDGRSGDPVYPHAVRRRWRGIVIEPQRAIFESQLAATYRGIEGVALENVAIADADGWRDLYKIAFSDRRWATGLASLCKDQFTGSRMKSYVDRCVGDERSKVPDRQEHYYTTERVRSMTFATLLDKYKPEKIDLLQIDAEGYDDELLRLYDFGRLRPALIQYEHHLTGEARRKATRKMLREHGYATFPDGINTVAVLRAVVSRLDATLPTRFDSRESWETPSVSAISSERGQRRRI